jgi:predicted transcriptional regulator of viral defense system
VGDDEAIAELAERQHGVVTRSQLVALGLGRGAIAERLRKKRLHHLHQGVYAVGHRGLTRLGWWVAAVLACGADAVLSHRCAAVLWGILDGWPTTVDVTVPRRLGRRDGIRLHKAAIASDERTVHASIAVTTVARTLLDLAAVLQPHELNRALERAEALRLSDSTPLVALLKRHRGRRGTAKLNAALKEGLRPAVTKSELERRFLSFVEKAGLPRPKTNVWLNVAGEWIEVDCVWLEQRVIVELDSRAYHQTTEAFERDRRRDRRLHAAGWRPVRVTDRALREEAGTLREELAALLSAAVRARSA